MEVAAGVYYLWNHQLFATKSKLGDFIFISSSTVSILANILVLKRTEWAMPFAIVWHILRGLFFFGVCSVVISFAGFTAKENAGALLWFVLIPPVIGALHFWIALLINKVK